MYKLEDIEAIHIEPTEKCNLSCLMCDRNKNGGEVNQYLKNRELTYKDIVNTFKPDFIKQLKRVYCCGNYGDPAMNKHTPSILSHFKTYNKNIKTSIITNGSVQWPYWWEDLAKVCDVVRFSIDGLQDTNKLYRQNCNWDLIIDNAKAYIDAGGYAIWDYLVFGHNEHQIEYARQLSKELGFKEFVVKKTGRFFSNIKLEGKDEHHGLTKPKQKENINKSTDKEKQIKIKYGSMERYLNQTQIECKVLKNKEFYLSAEGIVLPCCWLAGQMYKWYWPEKYSDIWNVINKDQINIKKRPLKEIFKSGIFKDIKDTWLIDTLYEGKLKTCALKCGKELDQFGDQFK